MLDSRDPLLSEVAPRLRLLDAVQNAVARLSSAGYSRMEALPRLALSGEAPIEFRLDAVALLAAATRDPGGGWVGSLLACEEDIVFIEALKAMRNFGPEAALLPLTEATKSTGNPRRRAVLAWALAAYPGNTEAEAALVMLAEGDGEAVVREHAIESLGEFRSSRSLKTLVHSLESGSETERFWALFSLGNLGDPVAVDAIRRCLDDHTEIPGLGTIADEANRALAKIEDTR